MAGGAAGCIGWGRLETVAAASMSICASCRWGPEGLVERVRAAFPQAALVVLSDDDAYADVAAAATQGARGFFSTAVDLAVLVQGIRLVLMGGTAMPIAVPPGRRPPDLREAAPAGRSQFSAELFTPKELEVLRSLASGRPNKLIAHELAICETTVKVHLRHIFRKLGTTNRTHAALLAREMLEGDGRPTTDATAPSVSPRPSSSSSSSTADPDPAQDQLVGFEPVDDDHVRHTRTLRRRAGGRRTTSAGPRQRGAEARVAQQVPQQALDRRAQPPRGRLGRRRHPSLALRRSLSRMAHATSAALVSAGRPANTVK